MRGFTLIELLVTVAIVGILAGISIVAFDEYRQHGYLTQTLSAMRNLVTGVEAYKANDIDLNFTSKSCQIKGATKSGQCEIFTGINALSDGIIAIGALTGATAGPTGGQYNIHAANCRSRGVAEKPGYSYYSHASNGKIYKQMHDDIVQINCPGSFPGG